MKYQVRDRQTGTMLDMLDTREEAEKVIEEFENEDKRNNEFTSDYYEIVEIQSYVVFEELIDKGGNEKTYGLVYGVYGSIESAEKEAKAQFESTDEDIFIADYDDYMNGNYNYIKAFKH